MSKYDKSMMETAFIFAKHSSCTRKKVAAVLAKENRVLNTAYNGTVSGLSNDCELICENCSGKGCDVCQGLGKVSNPDVIHAEKNLIAFCAQYGISTKDTTVYITLSPCQECASLMAQAGVKKVFYSEKYRDVSGIEDCKRYGIEIEQLEQLERG